MVLDSHIIHKLILSCLPMLFRLSSKLESTKNVNLDCQLMPIYSTYIYFFSLYCHKERVQARFIDHIVRENTKCGKGRKEFAGSSYI